MARYVKVEFYKDAADALDQLRQITAAKDAVQVVTDALKFYEWCLMEQTLDHRLVVLNGGDTPLSECDKLVLDRRAAMEYFGVPEPSTAQR